MVTVHLFAVHHEKSLLPVFFRVFIDHLFVNLEPESGKTKYYCFGKSLGSLKFWIQKSVRTLFSLNNTALLKQCCVVFTEMEVNSK